MSDELQKQSFVTRKAGVEMVRARGIPLTLGRVNKDTYLGKGPPVEGRYGNSDLYDPDKFMQYAIDRVRRVNTAAA